VGLVAHPWEGLDVYGYAGIEQVNANSFNLPAGTPGGNLFGFGNPGFSNVGCTTTSSSSFAGTVPANCIANNLAFVRRYRGLLAEPLQGPIRSLGGRRPMGDHPPRFLRRHRGGSLDQRKYRFDLTSVLSVLR
jgi:hypothetical protein